MSDITHLAHGLFELFQEIIKQHNKSLAEKEQMDKLAKASYEHERLTKKIKENGNESFIWVSKNLQDFESFVIDLVKKGEPIPYEWYKHDKEGIYNLLEKSNRLDLLPKKKG